MFREGPTDFFFGKAGEDLLHDSLLECDKDIPKHAAPRSNAGLDRSTYKPKTTGTNGEEPGIREEGSSEEGDATLEDGGFGGRSIGQHSHHTILLRLVCVGAHQVFRLQATRQVVVRSLLNLVRLRQWSYNRDRLAHSA